VPPRTHAAAADAPPDGCAADLLERPPLLVAGNFGDAARGLAAAQLGALGARSQFLGGPSALHLVIVLFGLHRQRPAHHVVDHHLRAAGGRLRRQRRGGACRRCTGGCGRRARARAGARGCARARAGLLWVAVVRRRQGPAGGGGRAGGAGAQVQWMVTLRRLHSKTSTGMRCQIGKQIGPRHMIILARRP